MKVDQIIKNAKIFTSDKENLHASAIAVKDGKFVYVGDEAGLKDYEGEVTDLGGKFIMPGIIDSHVHVTMPVGFEYAEMGERMFCSGKQELMDSMADYIKSNPEYEMDILFAVITEQNLQRGRRELNTNKESDSRIQ